MPGRWLRLLRVVVDHGSLGVIALVLLVPLACVLSGADAALVYALVALVVACTIMIAVAAIMIRRGNVDASGPRTTESPGEQPTSEGE